MKFMITSETFEDEIPQHNTCDGDNVNPQISIDGVPENAESLILIVDDPDAATDPDEPGHVFDHWILYDIPAENFRIEENSFPKTGKHGLNSVGEAQYTGPCPPNGVHTYCFRAYALDKEIGLVEPASRKDIEKEMRNHIVAQAQITATYELSRTASK